MVTPELGRVMIDVLFLLVGWGWLTDGWAPFTTNDHGWSALLFFSRCCWVIVNCELPSKNGGLVLYNKDKRVIILMIVYIYNYTCSSYWGLYTHAIPTFFHPIGRNWWRFKSNRISGQIDDLLVHWWFSITNALW